MISGAIEGKHWLKIDKCLSSSSHTLDNISRKPQGSYFYAPKNLEMPCLSYFSKTRVHVRDFFVTKAATGYGCSNVAKLS